MRELRTHDLNTPLYSDVVARLARYSPDQILDGVVVAARERGIEVSITDIAVTTNVPSDSVCHRFFLQRELLVWLWLRSIRCSQKGFV